MATIKEIDEQIEKLNAQRAEVLKTSRLEILAEVKANIKNYKITPTELKSVLKPMRSRKAKIGADDVEVTSAPAKKVGRPKKAAKT